MEIYKTYQLEIEEIKKLKAEQNTFRINIQNYDVKKNENEMVRKELEFVGGNDIVYKLTGPLLVKEDTNEAKANVAKRIEFIAAEIDKFEKKIKSHEEIVVKKTKQVQDIQAKLINAQRALEKQG